jgi:hypothetical protein
MQSHKQRIKTKNGWNNWIFNSVDWDSQNKALNTLELLDQVGTQVVVDPLPHERHRPS